MPQFSFGKKSTPLKVLDAGPDGAWIALQVLDASTLFFDSSRDILSTAGAGAAPNNLQGFQLKTAQGILMIRWQGELWAQSDTDQSLIYWAITQYRKSGGCGCGGGSKSAAPGNPSGVADPQIEEGL